MRREARTWLLVILGVPMMLMLAGCALYADDGGGGGGQGSGGEGGGGGTITFLHWRGEDQQVFDQLADGFKEETGVTVEQSVLPSDTYTAQSQNTILSGKGADVFGSMPGAQFRQLSEAGMYADISGEDFAGRFDEEFIAAGATEDGEQLAYPLQLVFNIPVYNVGLFEKAGIGEPPTDWEGFLSACDALKEQDVAPIAFAGNVSANQFVNPMLMNNQPDEEIFQKVEAGEAKVTEEWYVKTLEQIKELQDRGCFQENPLGSTQEGVSALFAQEKAAMLALGSYQMATVEQQNPEIQQGLLAPITVSEDEKVFDGIYTSTFMLGVNAKSENKEAANAWIEFITRPENAAEYANNTGQLLTLKEVEYTSEILKIQEPWQDKKVRFQPRYTITQEPINQALITSVEDVLGGTPPQEAAEKFQGEVDRAIGAGG
jgi:raffinose/stachyose/melibiose transport system substrate-binding protein